MSYILDALRKSDLQRQHGMAPTLQGTTLLARTHAHVPAWVYGVLAILLIAAGIGIGWVRPWQSDKPAQEPSQSAPAQLRDPAATPPVAIESVVAQQAPARQDETPVRRAPPPPFAAEHAPASAAHTPADAAPVKVLAWAELPTAIQQELPALNITVHAYSARPADRMVGINNSMLREGASIAPGLKLDEITPDGMVFSYKGYRFKRSIQN